MTQAVGTGGSATYTYNGAGLKVQRVGPDGTTRYYYDGIRPIWETDGIGTMTAELDRDIFGNLLSSRDASSARRYYHPDGLGSTTGLTDEAGNVAASMLYDAWGQVRATSGAGIGKYQFTGAELDAASGLYHMGARFYDPSIGRWLSEDPLQKTFEPASLNFYAYIANNPLVFVDPTGMRPTGPCDDGGCDSGSSSTSSGSAAAGCDSACETNHGRQNAVIRLLEQMWGTSVQLSQLQIDLTVAVLMGVAYTGGPSTNKHHVWPMYLGGAIQGTRIVLNAGIHRAYHAFLDSSGLARQRGTDFYREWIARGGQPFDSGETP